MKAVMLYHPSSQASRVVEEYVHDFEKSRGRAIKLIGLNTKDGAAIASLYDIVRYPGLLVLRDDGQLVAHWQGENLPLMNEVDGYMDR